MELNLAQELSSMDQDSLLLVFLDLRKEYDNLDCGQLLKTLEGYGSRPKMRGIMAEFWAHQEVFTQKMAHMAPSSGQPAETHRGD